MELEPGPKNYIKGLKFLMKNNPNYQFYYDFIYKNAKEKKRQSFTKQEQKELDEILLDEKFPEKECYNNSRRLLLRRKGDKLDYYEGWVDAGLFPIEHAWCEFKGKIVDVTLVDREPHELKDLPEEHRKHVSEHTKKEYPKATYYGVKLPRKFVFHQLVNGKTYLLTDFAFTCMKPLKEGKKPPPYCGDVDEYKI